MSKSKEEFLVVANNVVYNTKYAYISKTVKAYFLDISGNEVGLSVEEVGDNFVVISDTLGSTILFIT